jgi:peptidoglycan/xylan/chitin deacetylase (PgdA/CDA1 family)
VPAYGKRIDHACLAAGAAPRQGDRAGMSVRVPILMYHEVTPRPVERYRKYSVTPAELGAQLDWLRTAGYTAVGMDAVLDAWHGEHTLPRRPVVITFDDGSRDGMEHAVPALAARGFTATFYVVADCVGATMRWLPAEVGFEIPTADWPALREAEAAGMRCEAHSMTHPRLARLTADECRSELTRSREIIAERLGRDVRHLAYPFGSYTQQTREIAAEVGYVTACTTHEALATPADDLLLLPRVPVLGTEGMSEFVHRVRTAEPMSRMRARVERFARHPRNPGERS